MTDCFPIEIPDTGTASALLDRPADCHSLPVLGHGAGAGMRHTFMEQLVEALGRQGVAGLRYQFPYMEQGGRRPDRKPVTVVEGADHGFHVSKRTGHTDDEVLEEPARSIGGWTTDLVG